MNYLKKSKVILAFILVFITSVLMSINVFAETAADSAVPYNSYTYWYEYSVGNKAVYSRPMYEKYRTYDFVDLGLSENFTGITDLYSDNDNTYILDKSGRIIILDDNYKLKKEIHEIVDTKNKASQKLNNPMGIFVSKSKTIYVADTDNQRVICCDIDGNFVSEYTLPDSKLIPSDFIYKPIKVSVDSKGYLYVLSEGSYYGAILYSPEQEFLGFYGANKVKGTVVSNLKRFFENLFSNDKKKSASERALPYQFIDFYIDNKDFVYTATGNTNLKYDNSLQTGQIKRLSPGGIDILKGEEIAFADTGYKLESQDIIGIEVDDNGFIYAIDSKYGHIFVYDSECTILSVFGTGFGEGNQDGSFSKINALTLNDEDVVVVDEVLNTVSTFRLTDYGKKLKEAQAITIKGKYSQTKEQWNEILSLDSNCQVAYAGLAKYYYSQNEFDEAMKCAKVACDRDTYALSFEQVRNELLRKYIIWFVLGVAILTVLLFLISKNIKRKYNFKLSNYSKLKTYLSVIPHPALSFSELKEKKNGSLLISVVIVVLYYITSVMCVTNGGFAYTIYDAESFNALFVLLRTVCVVALFSIAFWAVSTLKGGLGKMSEIFVVTSYSITPLVISNVLTIIFTNILIPNELGFLNIISYAMILYTAFLLCMGLIIINDFSFGQFVSVGILSICGMVIILFLIIVVVMLLQLLNGFGSTIFNEILRLFR